MPSSLEESAALISANQDRPKQGRHKNSRDESNRLNTRLVPLNKSMTTRGKKVDSLDANPPPEPTANPPAEPTEPEKQGQSSSWMVKNWWIFLLIFVVLLLVFQ